MKYIVDKNDKGMKEVSQKFALLQFISANRSNYEFEIAIPKYSRLVSGIDVIEKPKGEFSLLACLESPPEIGVQVQISCCKLPREVGGADLAYIHIARAGGNILHEENIYGPGGRLANWLVEYKENGKSDFCRAAMLKDKDHLFLIEAKAPKELYPNLAEDLLIVVDSFRLLRPQNVITAEPLTLLRTTGFVSINFSYPSSWLAHEKYFGDRYNLTLSNNFEDFCAGQIVTEIHRHHTVQGVTMLVEDYANELQRIGVRRNGAPIIPIQPMPSFIRAWVYAPTATFQEQTIDVPVLVLEHSLALVLIGLIGPSKQTSPEWWAINKRAFEIVRDSLKISDAMPYQSTIRA